MQLSETSELILISSLLQESPQRSKPRFITLLLLEHKETINQTQSAPGWFLLPFFSLFSGLGWVVSLRFILLLLGWLLPCFSVWF